jgi:hypothetical protein
MHPLKTRRIILLIQEKICVKEIEMKGLTSLRQEKLRIKTVTPITPLELRIIRMIKEGENHFWVVVDRMRKKMDFREFNNTFQVRVSIVDHKKVRLLSQTLAVKPKIKTKSSIS